MNTGLIWVGFNNAITDAVLGGTKDATAGYELSPNRDLPWLRVENLQEIYFVSEVAGEGVTFMALA